MQIGEIDLEKLEQGDWVDNIPEMGELRLKTRGANNKDWRRMQNRLLSAVPRQKKVGGLDPDESDRITAILLRETALLDWEGILAPDGTPLKFSKAQANEYLTNPKYGGKFLSAALFAANIVAEQQEADAEDISKN